MITLRYLKSGDIVRVLEWQKGKCRDDLYQWAGPGYSYPLTYEQIEQRLLSDGVNQLDGDRFIYAIELGEAHQLIGQIELVINDREKGIASIGKFIIGETQYRGMGYGQATLEVLVNRAFKVMNLQHLYLKVFDFNVSAIVCYERLGFTKVRYEREVYQAVEGFWNRYYMALDQDVACGRPKN